MSKRVLPVFLTAVAVVAISATFNMTNVSAGVLATRCLDQTGCCRRCPACDHVCKLDAKVVDEEKKCFEVEAKVICIPRVVFPWQKKKSCSSCDACDGRGCTNCVHNGARTRKICVLKTKTYECPKCKYTWSAEKKPCATGCCDSGCCDAGGCDAGCAASPSDWAPLYPVERSSDVKATEIVPQPTPQK